MELTKHGHACVALSKDGRRLVVDPGSFTDPGAIGDADAVLVTHEHGDHLSEPALLAALDANPALRIWTTPSVAEILGSHGGRVTAVGQDDAFEASGFSVEVYGEWHAVIHPDIPRVQNVGFLVDGTVFHPGDALLVPGRPVDTLLTPVHAPWSKTGEIVDWVREVGPARTYSVHDGLLNEIGLGMTDRLLGDGGPGTGARHTRLGLTEHVTL